MSEKGVEKWKESLKVSDLLIFLKRTFMADILIIDCL